MILTDDLAYALWKERILGERQEIRVLGSHFGPGKKA